MDKKGSLTITRMPGESVLIGDDIKVTIVLVRGNQVRVNIVCDRAIKILRGELIREEQDDA